MSCVLLITYDPIRRVLCQSLLEQDYDRIVSCVCFEDAFRFLAVEHPDVISGIVLDLHLPHADWCQWEQQIQMPICRKYDHVPILAMSPHESEAESSQICHEYHVDDYLALPVDPQRFRQRMQALVRHSTSSIPLRSRLLGNNDLT